MVFKTYAIVVTPNANHSDAFFILSSLSSMLSDTFSP